MFSLCKKLDEFESNFDTSNVNDMREMFWRCHQLRIIKGIDKFKTNKVSNMAGMFQECDKLVN